MRDTSQFPFPAAVPWSYPPDAINNMGKNKGRSLVFIATVILNLTVSLSLLKDFSSTLKPSPLLGGELKEGVKKSR